MPEVDLEILRLRLRVEVLSVLVGLVCSALADASPVAANTLREKFAMLRDERNSSPATAASSEMEKLVSTEFLQALNDVLAKVDPSLDR